MADEKIKISELDVASQSEFTDDALLALDVEDQNSEIGYSTKSGLLSRLIAYIKTKLGIEDLNNVNITASDNNKLLGVSVTDNVISVGAVDEIPNLNNIAWQSATRNNAGGFTGGQCRYIKCGKLVIGVIDDLIGVNSTHNAVVFSNLPTPQTSIIGLIQFTGNAFKAPFRVRITGGNIVNWYSSIDNVQGSEGYMFFAYVSE